MAKVLEILRKYTQQAPVDVEAIAAELGIPVLRGFLSADISGVIERGSDGRYRITVNASDSLARQRFTIAHEIAHYLYHRDLIGDGIADSPAYRAPNLEVYANTRIQPKHETQANQFAANILMPLPLIRTLEAENPGISLDALAKRLKVSLPALRVRKGMTPYPDYANEYFEQI